MISFLMGMCLGIELLGHMIALSLTFQGIALMFSKAAALFYIPSNVCGGSNSSISLLTLIIILLMNAILMNVG